MAFQKWGTHTFSLRPYTVTTLTPYGKELRRLRQERQLAEERALLASAKQRQQTALSLPDIISQLQKQAAEARAENLKRYAEATGIYKQIEQMYAPGGSFMKGAEAMIERGKKREIARGMQSLVSAGLAGTTRAAGLGRLYEEEVAMPARLRLEDLRTGSLAQAMAGRAGLIERRQDVYPDLGIIAQLMSRI